MVQDASFGLHVAPHTNRGVVNATGTFPREFLLFDWIQVTIFPFTTFIDKDLSDYIEEKWINNFYNKGIKRINNYYDLFWYLFRVPRTEVLYNEFTPLYGYQFCYSYKNIKVLGSDSRPEMGVHILLSGTACRELEDLGVPYDDLFYKLRDYKPHYTRIDVSFDDYQGKYWTLERIAKCINEVEVVTRFRSSLSIKKDDLISLDNIGHTIQFGSRSSDIQFTFYDKLKERRCNNVQVDESIKHWNRFETRFRNNKAQNVINNYLYHTKTCCDSIHVHIDCESFNDYIKSVISNYISFRVRSATDDTRSRWKLQPWWQEFLDNCKKIQFQTRPIEYSITKKKAWIDKSVSFSNFCVLLAEIPDLSTDEQSSSYLYNLFMTGSDKLTDKDLQFINEYRISHNLSVLDMTDIKDYVESVKDILIRK